MALLARTLSLDTLKVHLGFADELVETVHELVNLALLERAVVVTGQVLALGHLTDSRLALLDCALVDLTVSLYP